MGTAVAEAIARCIDIQEGQIVSLKALIDLQTAAIIELDARVRELEGGGS